MDRVDDKGFTIIELLVVVLILGLLSAIAVGVYTTHVERARVAAAKSTIHAIEVAINRYQVDLGDFPLSGTGDLINNPDFAQGCGNLELALMHSVSGNSKRPASPAWRGPYLSVKREMLGDINGVIAEKAEQTLRPGDIHFLDPWNKPYRYIRSGPGRDNYVDLFGTKLPDSHPYSQNEIYYNPNTFQIVSCGPNGTTDSDPNKYGTEGDDVTNFGF